jgi:multidrug efflux pump subunit AcrA (membrane-fusion protein)
LRTETETLGVIEVFQRPGAMPNVQRGYLRFLLQMCELVGDWLKSRQLRDYTERQTLWTQLEQFTRNAHQSLDPRATAYTIANEGRRLCECDRVSIAINRGRKCTIEAVSGQDTFDKRSNTVTMLGRLATAVAATGEAVWYTGDTENMPPQVEDALQEYIDEAHSKTVAIIPLKKLKTNPDDKEPPEVIGALIVEQIEDSRIREGFMQRVEVVAEHSETALTNALEYHSLFLLPVWQTLGKAQWVLKARTLPKTIAITSAIVITLLFLALFPADFTLEGKGTLLPVIRREVFASQNGTVDKLFVKHGDAVAKDAVLAEMTSTDLDIATAKTVGELNTVTETIYSLSRQISEAGSRGKEKLDVARLYGQMEESKQTLASLQKQLDLLAEKREKLKITSPIDGQITEPFRVEDVLLHRPVQQGQIMMSLANPNGEWELEINMPEEKMGHIVQAQKDIKPNLDVEYILAVDPGSHHQGTVTEIHRSAEVRGEEGNTVLIRVAIDKRDIDQYLKQGATATAKIHCGRASIGYVWFHQLIAWTQKMWFRL